MSRSFGRTASRSSSRGSPSVWEMSKTCTTRKASDHVLGFCTVGVRGTSQLGGSRGALVLVRPSLCRYLQGAKMAMPLAKAGTCGTGIAND